MIYNIFGHFHPVLVHIPIGVLLLAFLMEFFVTKKKAAFSFIIEITLLIGSISAIVAALLGWLLSFSGEYEAALLTKHQWWGISLCIASLFLWIAKKFAGNNQFLLKLYRPLFFLSILLLMVTGHFGGSLTHGEDYLSFQSFMKEAGKREPDTLKKQIQLNELTPDLTIYKNLVNPVFDAKCISCHNDKKKKGKFQMDTYELLLKGGKSGKKIVGTGVQNSELLRRMLLDKNDDKHMPPKGKRQLTKPEIDLIYWWVQTGALPEKRVLEVKMNDTIKAFLSDQELVKKPALPLKNVNKASPADLAPYKIIHLEVSPISKGSPFLEVNAINVPELNDAHLEMLQKIAPQVAWLMIGDTKITDAGMPAIVKCANIVKLNLQNTGITNASIPGINRLQHLEYLNIVGTQVDDDGLFQLSTNKSLKKIFCWKTNITKEGVARFKELNRLVEIDFFLK